ncbi:MAG: hypothetical protein Kapaf2KO_13490 [Candidatus Kapaibacteriales bacterium]
MATEFVAKELCVQKEIENNCCQGSCFVENNIIEAKESDATEGWLANILENYQLQEFYTQYYFQVDSIIPDIRDQTTFLISLIYLKGFLSEIFRPPELLSYPYTLINLLPTNR